MKRWKVRDGGTGERKRVERDCEMEREVVRGRAQ